MVSRKSTRSGGVYIAVLGTSLIVAVLALSALTLQRVQNRMLTASADVRQAQLNAEAAIEIGLLEIDQNANWRTDHVNGAWFSNRSTGAGGCTLEVVDIDPLDAILADDASDGFTMTGIGTSGSAEQRVVRTVDPYPESLACLRSSVAVGDAISVTGGVLRATNSGLISANSTSATSSTVYGNVQATSISGSTYSGTTTQILAADLPAMPDWATVFDYYRTNGTEVNINSLPTTTPNLGRNVGIEIGPASPVTDWTGSPPGIASATIGQSSARYHSGSNSLRVQRATWQAGAAQRIDDFVERGQQYYVETWVVLPPPDSEFFRISLYTKGTGDSSPQIAYQDIEVINLVPFLWEWDKISATLMAGNWTGDLEYAFIKIAGDPNNATDFYLDDFYVRKSTSGRFIYRQVLGPAVNTLDPTRLNAQGIYWIDCGGNQIVIERSRINGTLLLVNPGTGSTITGPISWSPAVAGYPALLVDTDPNTDVDFVIGATNRTLSEAENSVDYSQDSDYVDAYPSEIEGLVVVEDDVTFQSNALVRGEVIVGDDLSASSGALEVVYRPDSLLNPPPGFSIPPTEASRPLSIRKAVSP